MKKIRINSIKSLIYGIITGLPAYRLTGLPAYRLTGLPAYRLTGLPAYRLAYHRLDQPAPASSNPDRLTSPSVFPAKAGIHFTRCLRSGLYRFLLCLPLFLGFAAGEAQAQTTLSISAPADANEGDSSTRDLTCSR